MEHQTTIGTRALSAQGSGCARRVRALGLALCVCLAACEFAPRRIELPVLPARADADAGLPKFNCQDENSHGCQGSVHVTCARRVEFLEALEQDCAASGQICDVERGCITCKPGTRHCRDCTNNPDDCNPNIVEACDDQGASFSEVEECGLTQPDVCYQDSCINACQLAQTQNNYAGCQFFAADLDNAAIDDMNNASAQQYAVVVANPQRVPVEVRVDLNDAPFGMPVHATEVDTKLVAPGDLEVFKLPRREVDGSSETGINDGTDSAISSNAYRVTSNYPISAYQFNPLENVNVFSNDASLLLPVPALGTEYTVVGWPQTIGNSSDPAQDFDHTSSNEDLRAFLTILGAKDKTHVRIELGNQVMMVLPTEYFGPQNDGDVIEMDIGPFDVINLETAMTNSDFTGTFVQTTQPVAVFVGSEASDVPRFNTYPMRQCCADHLEEQLLPDSSAGTQYAVGRMPSRTHALNNAALPGAPLGVAEVDEPEWIRVVTIAAGNTRIRTTLDPPDNDFTLPMRGDAILRADRDFIIESDRPIQVLEALASQGVTGIPKQYPGGDPSIITVPPVEQFRKDYIFLTPDKYAFDFVTIVAPPDAEIEMDGAPLPDSCESSDMPLTSTLNPQTAWVVHRCQLSFPQVTNGTSGGGLMGGLAPSIVKVLPGDQHDGAHTIVSNQPVSIVVYGFDRFVSYAYVGGLNLTALN
jgi:IgGFc binding protein